MRQTTKFDSTDWMILLVLVAVMILLIVSGTFLALNGYWPGTLVWY